jgi:hypothetical protein
VGISISLQPVIALIVTLPRLPSSSNGTAKPSIAA